MAYHIYFHRINDCVRDIYLLLIHMLGIFSLINVCVRDIYPSLKLSGQNYTLTPPLLKGQNSWVVNTPWILQASGSQSSLFTTYIFSEYFSLRYHCLLSLKRYLLKHLIVFKSIKRDLLQVPATLAYQALDTCYQLTLARENGSEC